MASLSSAFSIFAVASLFLLGCNRQSESSGAGGTANAPVEKSEQYKRGKSLYQAHCASCHALNPKVAGGLGPEVYGSSLELLSKRLLEASYPEGYTPKRPTKVMQSMPHLKSDLDSLFAYLNE